MKNFLSSATSFIREEKGASAVEYAILVAAIATVIVVVTLFVGVQVENIFNRLCNSLAVFNSGITC